MNTPVSLTDVAPTVLMWLGLPVGTVDGVDLGPLLRGEPMERGPVFSEATKPRVSVGVGLDERDALEGRAAGR